MIIANKTTVGELVYTVEVDTEETDGEINVYHGALKIAYMWFNYYDDSKTLVVSNLKVKESYRNRKIGTSIIQFTRNILEVTQITGMSRNSNSARFWHKQAISFSNIPVGLYNIYLNDWCSNNEFIIK